MSIEPQQKSPGQLARESFEVLFDRRDPDALRWLWSEQSVNHFLALGTDPRGPDEIVSFFKEFLAAIPDLRMTIENIVEGERQAAVQWTANGTFDGAAFQGIEPTGKPVVLRGCDVLRYTDDGKLDANTIYYDGAEFARQLGMLPPRDSTADRALVAAFNARMKLRQKRRERMERRP
jgi:steroid delta-isomerase-like uncharacterized protein